MVSTAGPLLKQGKELGVKAVFSFGDGACTDKMGEFAGSAADGLLCSQAADPPQAHPEQFLGGYQKRVKVQALLYSAVSSDPANLLLEAVELANSAEPVYCPAGPHAIQFGA